MRYIYGTKIASINLNYRTVIENAVEEGRILRGNIALLEAKAPAGEAKKQIENAVRQEVEEEWKDKWISSAEENENLNEIITMLQQVTKHILHFLIIVAWLLSIR